MNKLPLLLSIGATLCVSAHAQLLSYWPLDEGSGTSLGNTVGGGTTGALFTGGSWYVDAQRGNVLEFNGSGGYADLGLIPPLAAGDSYTISFWSFDLEALVGGSNNIIVGNRNQANGSDALRFTKFTTRAYEYYGSAGSQNLDYADQPTGTWVQNTLVKSGTTMVYYRNGLYGGKRTITGDISVVNPLYLGGDKTTESWKGRVDSVAFWSGAVPTASVARIAAGTATPATVAASQASLTTVFSEDFSGGLSQWNVTNRGLENNAPAGYNAPSTAGGVLTLGGTAGNPVNTYWFGTSIESTQTFDATKETWIGLDRVSLGGTGSAFRSSLWVLGDNDHYLHFSENKNENGWTYNARDVGGLGMLNGTGTGTDLLDANGFEDQLNHQMGIRLMPTGDAGDLFAYMYIDGNIVGSQAFTNFPSTFTLVLTGQGRTSGDSVDAKFDNVSVQQVPEPATAMLALAALPLLARRQRRRE